MNQVFVAILALAGATITALGGYLIAKHQRSGKVDTTDADSLWQEGKDLREFLKDRIRALDGEVKDLKFEVRELKLEIAGLRAEIRRQAKP